MHGTMPEPDHGPLWDENVSVLDRLRRKIAIQTTATLPLVSEWPLQCQGICAAIQEHTYAFFQARMSEPQRDQLDAAIANVSYPSKKIDKLNLVIDKVRHTDKPTPQSTIDYYDAMQTEVIRLHSIAGGVRYTLERRYSVLHKLYCV